MANGVRERLERHKGLSAVVAILVIAGAWGAVFWSQQDGPPTDTLQDFYTADGGKTFFLDDYFQVPPFQKDGQEVVRATVFTTDGGKTQFVGYMTKYTDEARAKLIEVGGDKIRFVDVVEDFTPKGILVAKPGGEWVSAANPKAREIYRLEPPTATPVPPPQQ